MPHQKGSNVTLLIGYESTFKSAPSAGYQLPFNSFALRANRAKNAAATIQGNRSPVAPFDGNLACNGPIVVPVDSGAMPYWLTAMFGDPTSGSGPPYEHEWKIGADMPSVTLETAFTDLATDQYNRFVGCKIGGFDIEFGGDGELVMTIDVFGADESLETTSFDAAPTAVALARLENFQAALTEGGSALSNARSLSVSVDFGLDRDQYVIGGGGVLGSIPEQICVVSGNLKTLFEDASLLNKALNSTESSLKVTVTGSSSSIFELEIQELEYERNSVDVPGPQGLLVDLNFQGYYSDGSEASAIVARVTNGVTGYDLVP